MSTTTKLTPLMQQYWEIKNLHTDKILLFRMGDFFEIFHDDAVTAAPILDIVLTSRNKKSEDDTPMCGVPHHSIAGPINKLLAKGFKVAICDQLEDPKQAKGIVKRGVTRILSPGMVYDPENLDSGVSNYIAAYDDKFLSVLEPTTGECFYHSVANSKMRNDLLDVILPKELVLSAAQKEEYLKEKTSLKGPYISVFSGNTNSQSALPPSAQVLTAYAVSMQGEEILKTLSPFHNRPLKSRMLLSPTVLKHLEVFETNGNDFEGSLFWAIDRTKTSAGKRLLKQWIRLPLTEEKSIVDRQNRVQKWAEDAKKLEAFRTQLASLGDVERRLGKISNPNCNPRDLQSVGASLQTGSQLAPWLSLTPEQKKWSDEAAQMALEIERTIVEEPPISKKQGELVRKGVRPELDELIELSTDGQSKLQALENKEKEVTGISSLKVRYNNVFGYYIEVTHTHKDKIPKHYQRKQTLVNAERYVTDELIELEAKILTAKSKRDQLEFEIFEELRLKVLSKASRLLSLAHVWAEEDIISAFAWLSLERRYTRPTFAPNRLSLKASRHAVVEQILSKRFVSNDITLEKGQCLLLTGPNMAGKSTLMRQVALTALLAQIGSYVPAQFAELPIFEEILTRIGSADALSQGLSTFMVEMTETAEILRLAQNKALVLLDEIGRGTSTYDGMSLAQAILEHLSEAKETITLFATHYHELTEMENNIANVKNAHMSIQEKAGDLNFLYSLTRGPANRSYGIEVAKRAGLPASVVQRAKEVLKEREAKAPQQLSLFMSPTLISPAENVEKSQSSKSEIEKHLENININELTPVEALLKLHEMKSYL